MLSTNSKKLFVVVIDGKTLFASYNYCEAYQFLRKIAITTKKDVHLIGN